jgi:acyl-coenzyme A thioesterase PaaI-like protein
MNLEPPTGGDLPSSLLARLRTLKELAEGDPFPSHTPNCLGCGPDNPHGYQLEVRRSGDGVAAEHVFQDRHTGAPGIAHGGAVATVFDDLFGFLLYLVGEIAVTRNLSVDYRAPVLLNTPHHLRADLTGREGRKLYVQAEMADQTGRTVATATATFIIVSADHFTNAAAPTWDSS